MSTVPFQYRRIPTVLAFVLAGGEGKRLWPLTQDRAKPAMPMAGRYRLIDFALSNLVNSGFTKIKVLTQYKSDSLNIHLARHWRLSPLLDQYVEAVPAQQRTGESWFQGSADAVYQSLNVLVDEKPDCTLVLGGDHLYKMDFRPMVDFHFKNNADCTVAALPVPIAEATAFGVMGVDEKMCIRNFSEKPAHPQAIPNQSDWALASMGIYVFSTNILVQALQKDHHSTESQKDFGKNIIPELIKTNYQVYAYDFLQNQVPGSKTAEQGYWKDVGTIRQYYQAHMDLLQNEPKFDLDNSLWPIRSQVLSMPPSKFLSSTATSVGSATNSLVAEGCIIYGGRVHNSILGPKVRIYVDAVVQDSILQEGVEICAGAQVRKTIIDKNIQVPAGERIGYDRSVDEKRFAVIDDLVVIPKQYQF